MYSHYEYESEQASIKSRILLRGPASREDQLNSGVASLDLNLDPDLLSFVRQNSNGSKSGRPARRYSTFTQGNYTLPRRRFSLTSAQLNSSVEKSLDRSLSTTSIDK